MNSPATTPIHAAEDGDTVVVTGVVTDVLTYKNQAGVIRADLMVDDGNDKVLVLLSPALLAKLDRVPAAGVSVVVTAGVDRRGDTVVLWASAVAEQEMMQ